MHVLLAAAMRSKHMDLFLQLEKTNESYRQFVEALRTLQAAPSPEKMKELEATDEYMAFMASYESF